jgi:hypothetical protein
MNCSWGIAVLSDEFRIRIEFTSFSTAEFQAPAEDQPIRYRQRSVP